MDITDENKLFATTDPSIPDKEKAKELLKDWENHNSFKCGDMTVQLKFADDEKPLAKFLIQYFKGLKTC